MCIHFMLVSTVEYKKAELNNQMKNTKEEDGGGRNQIS